MNVAEAVVATLLVLSGLFVLVSALGFSLLRDFFQRMHPPALAYTLGTWCVALGGAIHFSVVEARPALHPVLIIVVLCTTVPVTTVLLARLTLFRRRAARTADTPPPLTPSGPP